jgi:uncharacterized protein YbaP (TraB family)
MYYMNRLLSTALLLFLVISNCEAAEDRALFWRADSGTATVYLLGSIHYADRSFFPLRQGIERAFDQADHLVVEVDVDAVGARQYQALLREKGMYAGDETIRDNVSRETWHRLEQQLFRLGMPVQLVEKQKPGVLVLTLTAMQVVKLGYFPDLGIDQYLLNKAKPNKDVIPLETIEQQLDIFLNIRDGDLLLQETLYSLDEAQSTMTDMVDFWKRGDEQGMRQLLFDDALNEYPEFTRIYDRLIYQRNEQMFEKTQQFLSGKGSYFVVVGAAHLVGDKGIVNKLKQAGYDVERL